MEREANKTETSADNCAVSVPVEHLPWMHIYAQYCWHGEAAIAGAREALLALRDAIDRCLHTGMEQTAPGITNDGEGYEVKIAVRSMAALEREPLPYTADFAKGASREAKA